MKHLADFHDTFYENDSFENTQTPNYSYLKISSHNGADVSIGEAVATSTTYVTR